MKKYFNKFFGITLLAAISVNVIGQAGKAPNVVFVLADEWRNQSVGYNGNKDVFTPHLDKLAANAINFSNAISGTSVCCPYRGSLLTGQYPLTTGVFVNDVQLNPKAPSVAKVFKAAGYQTAYIGKWHLDGHGRSAFIPEDRRQGFEYWKALECTHEYYNSEYWGNDNKKAKWQGYDAYAQTADAVDYIKGSKQKGKPFFMILSWGPPHSPFALAPEPFKNLYADSQFAIRANVPEKFKGIAKTELAGYYGHIAALDSCIGLLQGVLKETGLHENTIFVFTSDHGAMLRSHAYNHKQRPQEESINVPLLISYPALFGQKGRKVDMLINTPDLMPTLLGLCGLPIPTTVEGADKTPILKMNKKDTTDAVLIAAYHAFGQWPKIRGGKEYRGVRTKRFTYAKDLSGPWLLFDNIKDPYQLHNLVNDKGYEQVRNDLEIKLAKLLHKTNDQFLPGMDYIKKWGYVTDSTGTVPYVKINYQGLPIYK